MRRRSTVWAIAIAHDELTSYIEVTGDEGSLDDEEMPDGKLARARDLLQGILDRYAVYEHMAAGRIIEVPPVRFEYRPTPPSGTPDECPRGGTHARIAHPGGRCIKCGASAREEAQ